MIHTIYIGNDHNGYQMKQAIIAHLSKQSGYEVVDLGSDSDEAVDYPGFAHAVAEKVGADKESAGIIICGSGLGVAMAANKVTGVRAAMCNNVELAESARAHNGANVLTLGAKHQNYQDPLEIVDKFLNTPLDPADRHNRRRSQLDAL